MSVGLLALQLQFQFEMRLTGCGLMGASEDGPCEDVCGWDTALCELHGEAADFLNRPPDKLCRGDRIVFFGVVALA